MKNVLIVFVMAVLGYGSVQAQVPAKLVQYPDVSETQICFTYGNDLWIVDKNGGDAIKLSSPIGRETNPKFSPDEKTIAFEANYDGNNDLYTLSVSGGEPTRVTGHGMTENIMDWYADGNSLLYASSMHSGKQRFAQFYKIAKGGGLPEKLPVEIGATASISADGNQLAFTDKSRVFRTWKRYRGGTAPDIFVMDLNTMKTENITNNDANDEKPMWHGSKIYYMSDNGPAKRNNIWVYDTVTKSHNQLTNFTDFDVHHPSIGPSDLVYQAAGEIYLMSLDNHESTKVRINAVGDFTLARKRSISTDNKIMNYFISPDGNRALICARGEIFTLPKKDGVVRNLTNTSGFAERYPAWSPDGKKIAYFTDKTGEYEFATYDIKTGEERIVSKLGPGFRYNIYWSPDSKHAVFVDANMQFFTINVETGATQLIDEDIALFEGGLRGFDVSWSSDSRWIAYDKTLANNNSAIFVYDMESKKSTQVTSGFYSDFQGDFDPSGDYLYLLTNRRVSPVYSDFDNTWVYPNATQIAAIPLRKDVKAPDAPKNDEVEIEEEEEESDEEGADDNEESEEEDGDEEEEDKVEIDFDGIEGRMIVLPVDPGNMSWVEATDGKVLYRRWPNSGSGGRESSLMYFDLEEQESKTIISGINGFELSHDGSSLIVGSRNKYGIIAVDADQKIEDPLAVKKMKMNLDPRAEWKQIFNDVWRFERDMFYDPGMHGTDWEALGKQYGDLIDNAQSRYDVNFLIGELIGELNASHTYRFGGDQKYPDYVGVGYLGVDWEKVNGQFKIKKIIKGASWDTEVKSPLDQTGLEVSEGDYVLEVNGMKLSDYTDPWIPFTGLAGQTVELTVSENADGTDSKKVLVKPIRSETRLRNLAWIESNREMVDKLSNGKIGYVYVPSTGIDGQNELIRMFYAQWDKEGLIIDERFNNGGQIPDRFVELLNRKPLAYFNVRNGKEWQWPPTAHFGPKAMLINGWSGSGGDAFPDYFRKAGLGPLIGSRTWGGLIGISGAPGLIDGGGVTVPTFRMYNPDGTWFKEGYGVDPDIEVMEDHEALAKGKDTQLERAVNEVMKEIRTNGYKPPKVPSKEDRSK